jgi:hypothetical protein
MISKKTVDECLGVYLEGKGISQEIIDKIVGALHTNVDKTVKIAKEKEEKASKKKAKVGHGTSCPRIYNPVGEMLIEM